MLYLVGHIDSDVVVDLISQDRQSLFVKTQTAKLIYFLLYDILYHVISVLRRSFPVSFHVYVGCLLDIGKIVICLWTSMELLQIEVHTCM